MTNVIDYPKDPKTLTWFAEQITEFGVCAAVESLLLRNEGADADWEFWRQSLLGLALDNNDEVLRAYCVVRHESEPPEIGLMAAIARSARGGENSLNTALAIARRLPGLAIRLGGHGDWFLDVFDDQENDDALGRGQQDEWVPLWMAVARRWQHTGVTMVLEHGTSQERERELLGMGVVALLGGQHIRWKPHVMETMDRRLGGMLTINPMVLEHHRRGQPFIRALGAHIRRGALKEALRTQGKPESFPDEDWAGRRQM